MKIIIVGAGIGGLAAYHALQKHLASLDSSTSIKIVESHASPTSSTYTIGGGLGLAPNGLRAIDSLSKSAAAYIKDQGFPGSHIWFRNSHGRLLGQFCIGKPERYGGYGQNMVPRAVVHEALLKDVPSQDIEWGRKVKRVFESNDKGSGDSTVSIEFEDGKTEVADLVIGADGVRSIVREALFGEKYPPEYDGLTGIGGFLPFSSIPPSLQEGLVKEGINMTFGAHGFFGFSMCSPLPAPSAIPSQQHRKPFIQWWSTYEISTPPHRDNVNLEDVRSQLLERHGSWKSPHDGFNSDNGIFKRIIELSRSGIADEEINTDTLILPRYITPRLPQWTSRSSSSPAKGRIVLLGDAAHAMPPDSGQGVSCAAEDAIVYALFLRHYLSDAPPSQQDSSFVFEQAARSYEEVRMPRVHEILDMAKRSGNMKRRKSWFEELIRDIVIWILCKLPESWNDKKFGYDSEVAVKEYLAAERT